MAKKTKRVSKKIKEEDDTQWSLKHRPTHVDQMVSATNLSRTIAKAKSSQALLITGSTGGGKTTLSRIVANTIQPNKRFHIYINAATETSINDVRQLESEINFMPQEGRWVVMIDEIHGMGSAAMKAMLVLLEDPPSQVLFICATDQPHRLPKQINNRTRLISIRPPSLSQLSGHLQKIAEKEGFKHKKLKKLCNKIAQISELVPRQAMQVLQDACDILGSGGNLDDALQVVQDKELEDIDYAVGKLLIAIFADDDPDIRASFIYKESSKHDAFGLISRMLSANFFGSVMMEGGSFDFRGKVYVKALKAKKIAPSIRQTIVVQMSLNAIKDSLREVSAEPRAVVTAGLANLPYLMDAAEPNIEPVKKKKKKKKK